MPLAEDTPEAAERSAAWLEELLVRSPAPWCPTTLFLVGEVRVLDDRQQDPAASASLEPTPFVSEGSRLPDTDELPVLLASLGRISTLPDFSGVLLHTGRERRWMPVVMWAVTPTIW